MNQEIQIDGLKVVIENPKGSYKDFETKGDPVWGNYPLEGVTYPVDYGYIDGYKSEDGHDLDVFVGSGNQVGYIKVWRYDVPEETKIILNCTAGEVEQILATFKPALVHHEIFTTKADWLKTLEKFKK